jgi:hypothetical protein
MDYIETSYVIATTVAWRPRFDTGVTVTFLCHMLQVVMTPSSMSLAKPRLSLVGTHHKPGMCWDTVLGHLLVVPLGIKSLGFWINMTYQGWQLSSPKGQWHYNRSLPLGSIMTLGCHYGVTGMNAGKHSHGECYLSCLRRVPQALRLNTLKRFEQPMWRGENGGAHKLPPGVTISCRLPWSQLHD